MPSAAVISTTLTTPVLTQTTLLVNGVDLTQWAEGISLSDQGLGSPRTLTLVIRDRLNQGVGAYLTNLVPIRWTNNRSGMVLFGGWIKDLAAMPIGPYLQWTVTCADYSDALDFSTPIQSDEARKYGGTDKQMIEGLCAYYGNLASLTEGGFIQTLAAAMPDSIPLQSTNLRGGIETVLTATGISGATYFVDSSGYLHTLVAGDTPAPYDITDSTTSQVAVATTQLVGATDSHLNSIGRDGAVLVTGTNPGGHVWRSADSGATWSDLGRPAPAGLTGTVDDISFVKVQRPGRWLLGCSTSGSPSALLVSTDAGLTFTKMFQAGTTALATEGFSVEAQNGVILIGGFNQISGAGANIWRSTDDGATFSSVSTTYTGAITIRQIRWVTGSTFIASVRSASPNEVHIYRSTDNGASWTSVQTIGSTEIYTALAMFDGQTVLLGTHPSGIIYRSTDGGASFTAAQNLGTIAGQSQVFGLTQLSDGTVLAFVDGNNNATVTVWASIDQGLNWTPIQSLGTTYHYHEPIQTAANTVMAPASNNAGGASQGAIIGFRLSVPANLLPFHSPATAAVDGLYVRGSTATGSGLIVSPTNAHGYIDLPRFAPFDAPAAIDGPSKFAAAATEIARRGNQDQVTAQVTAYGGWASGQTVTVTDAAYGWSAQPYVIAAVSSQPVTQGSPLMVHTLTLGADPIRFSKRIRAAISGNRLLSTVGSRISGQVGG